MELPITEKELEIIITTLKGPYPALYAKLWSHKINIINKEKTNEIFKINF
jgi:hypothetical protein